MREMILWGATGQAKVLRECLADRDMKLVALFDRDPGLASPFDDVPLAGGTAAFESWIGNKPDPSAVGFLVAIGGAHGADRLAVQKYLEGFGLAPLTACHRTAFVAASATIGAGSQVLANAAVCVDASLGRACIVNTGAIVDHDCRLGDGVHVAPGARLAGEVDIGATAMIGTGAVVLPRVTIGPGAVVGAGSVVLRDVPAGTTVVGNPAVPIEQRS